MTVYYKIQQILLQNTTANLLQNATEVCYKMRQVFYSKMRQFYYKMQQLLQNAALITNCDSFITKCNSSYKLQQFYYKIRQLLQNATFITNCDSTLNITLTRKPVYYTNKDFVVKFSIKDFFSKCDQIRSFLRIWSHLLKKFLMVNFIFCAVEMEESKHVS